jgi:hypothetical protein
MVCGWEPLTRAESVITLVRCAGPHLRGWPNAHQSAIIKDCALLFLKQFPEERDGMRLIAEIAPTERAFDFLCDERFWRHFDEQGPDARRESIRRAGTLCPFRGDVAHWTLCEMVALKLLEGRIERGKEIGTLFGDSKLKAFLQH